MEDFELDMIGDNQLDIVDDEEQDEDPMIEYQDEAMNELVAQQGRTEGDA